MSEKPKIHIRDFRPEDVNALVEIFTSAVRIVARLDYTQEQLVAWAPDEIDSKEWAAHYAARQTFVAEVGGLHAGFADLKADGHLNVMYVHADWQRQGIASALLSAIEIAARRLRLKRIYTEASITARPFFERRGFRLIGQQVVKTRGQEFVNFRMDKLLDMQRSTCGLLSD
jgi:putative acetyltransferase